MLKLVQSIAGKLVKTLYTLDGVPIIEDEELLLEEGIYSGLYWLGQKCFLFTVTKDGFNSAAIF